MEDIIWVFVGVVTMLIVLGIISGIISNKYEDDRVNMASSALESLIFHCDSVCKMPKGSYISFPVTLVRGVNVTGEQNSICITYDKKKSCRRCSCDVTVANLTLDEAPFQAHNYECFYLKHASNVSVNCTG